ncbi:hypothetical protein [Halobacillus yeomjeoni]|uniref:Holin n=1 Tax=Halobacillus yeomjeoni TaxID=311194 RepID=A0A931HR36_9BACI|nr:hypothetical protein [Halobacillus yeomjeoni]MBH0228595.1 hypothetical protein [Halobacillus yeomjeoni]
MKNLKTYLSRLKNPKVLMAILLGLAPLLATSFGIILPDNYTEIVTAVAGILVLLGILNDPNPKRYLEDSDKDGLPDFLDRNDGHRINEADADMDVTDED